MTPPGSVITESRTQILIPSVHSTHGPGKIEAGSVFFNEQMAFNRDVSIMLLRALGREKLTVADAMTATGARAVRIAHEVPGTEVTANDIDPAAMPYIETNIALNGLTNCIASNRNMHSLFSEQTFDYVDLDPFGSPSLFIQSAIRGCRKRGILAVTATDTAPLAGAQAGKCRRRYQSEPIRGYMCHEGGLRILIAAVAREMGKFDRGMRPLLSFYADHYYRTYVQIVEGADACDEMLSHLGYLALDPATLERSVSPTWDREHHYGSMWTGPLQDKELLQRMSPEGMSQEKRCVKMLGLWRSEVDTTPFLYDMSELSSFAKLSPPSLDTMVSKLQERGRTSMTHFCPTSFITELPAAAVLEVYRANSPDTIRRNGGTY
ncbi:MAG: N2,N2-dimethylguanosine tRNA methyltransferase [Candidatus Methanomethylophilus sp.]|nr:N2,N2-dimethylguanosine tRNA methyltransferase [Methanomethylophilus sp.]